MGSTWTGIATSTSLPKRSFCKWMKKKVEVDAVAATAATKMETVTECRMKDGRTSLGRMTEGIMTEGRMTEG